MGVLMGGAVMLVIPVLTVWRGNHWHGEQGREGEQEARHRTVAGERRAHVPEDSRHTSGNRGQQQKKLAAKRRRTAVSDCNAETLPNHIPLPPRH